MSASSEASAEGPDPAASRRAWFVWGPVIALSAAVVLVVLNWNADLLGIGELHTHLYLMAWLLQMVMATVGELISRGRASRVLSRSSWFLVATLGLFVTDWARFDVLAWGIGWFALGSAVWTFTPGRQR